MVSGICFLGNFLTVGIMMGENRLSVENPHIHLAPRCESDSSPDSALHGSTGFLSVMIQDVKLEEADFP